MVNAAVTAAADDDEDEDDVSNGRLQSSTSLLPVIGIAQ